VKLDDERYMRRAFEQARKSYEEGGCPIGGLLVANNTGEVLGEGHNALVQEGNPILHGEMAALRAAKRINRHDTTLYTTLQPCFMCAGTIVQFGIPRVVIGDTKNASSIETLSFMEAQGIEILILDPATSPSADACIQLVTRFRREQPALWTEDWGGGLNPRLQITGTIAAGYRTQRLYRLGPDGRRSHENLGVDIDSSVSGSGPDQSS
jgi:cytosine deaminase